MKAFLARIVLVLASLAAAVPSQAAFHLFSIDEIYSNADGSVQFIELVALAGGQQFVGGHPISASGGPDPTRSFTIPTNLPGDTLGKRFLIGTTGFAALGIVTPDYIVPNGFLFPGGGNIVYAFDTWVYPALPADGVLSLSRSGATGTNSPTNFAGQSGTIVPPPPSTFRLTVTKAGTGTGTITSTPAGIDCGATCGADFAIGSNVTLAAAAGASSVFTGWTGGGCTGIGGCVVAMNAASAVSATFALLAATPTPAVIPASVDFGGQSINTTAPALSVAVLNTGTGPLSVTGFNFSTAQFAQTNNCVSLATGANCSVNVTFTPTAQGAIAGTLTIQTSGGDAVVSLSGSGERSLVTHYYRSILRRAPDSGGKSFWESEAARMTSIGVDVNETWYSMAGSFYTSAEYLAFNRDNNGFVTDLYNTFYNRPPDGAGLAFWTGQIASGLPREVALASFMFSTEFVNFTQAIFGNTAVRKEIDTVVDFYRGILGRLPDTSGFNFWVAQFRAAQCAGAGAAAAVTLQAESISSQFALSGEYAARARNNTQYVGDLYNAFLRRGGDLGGVQFWIGQVATAAQTREQVRKAFVASPEFSARVAAVIAQGCQP